MHELAVRFPLIALGLFTLGCASPLHRGSSEYHDGMRRLRYDPAMAREDFSHADAHLAEALAEGDLELHERVTALSIRARSLIELGRHPEAAALASARIEGYDPERAYHGDLVGLALIRAHALDPERGYAELLAAEKRAQTLRSRRHLAWEQVHLLRKIGTPKAKAEAAKICDQHAGQIDFTELKKTLQD